MANGSTSSMNRMKTLTDKMKTPPGETPVVSDNTTYVIPGTKPISSIYDNLKVPTSSTSSFNADKVSNMSMNKTVTDKPGNKAKQLKKGSIKKGEGSYRIISNPGTSKADTTYSKSEQITKMQFASGSDADYRKFQRNREYKEYATKKGIIPNFDAIKVPQARSMSIKNFYSNQSNIDKLNKGQAEYFKNKGWDMVERDQEGKHTTKYPNYKGPIK